MPVVVNQNTHQDLRLVKGASYSALNIILDKACSGHRINSDTILHFVPLAEFVGMLPGTILLTLLSTKNRLPGGNDLGKEIISAGRDYSASQHSPTWITKCKAEPKRD
jgi:hypothetical protein